MPSGCLPTSYPLYPRKPHGPISVSVHVRSACGTNTKFVPTPFADGPRTGKYKNTGAYSKDQSWYLKPLNNAASLLTADEVTHPRMRRSIANAFSDRALRGQEPFVQQYVDLLIQRLSEQEAEDEPIDIMRWYNFTTFDVICDLSFGEPLYCLRDNKGTISVYCSSV
jgi:cytochrome P450